MARLTDKFSRIAALKPARSVSRPATLRAPDREDFLCQLLGAAIATNCYGEHVCVRNWFSSPAFAEPAEVTLRLLARSRDEKLSKRVETALSDSTKWLFLDTETTGLSGGTGTYAFLVGLAWWDAGGLQVEQLFLRDFAEEHSILQEVAGRLAERPVLVTFNGKTFDWPLLENRFTMTRAIPVPRLAAHLDLMHPARALWRDRKSTRLNSSHLVISYAVFCLKKTIRIPPVSVRIVSAPTSLRRRSKRWDRSYAIGLSLIYQTPPGHATNAPLTRLPSPAHADQ